MTVTKEQVALIYERIQVNHLETLAQQRTPEPPSDLAVNVGFGFRLYQKLKGIPSSLRGHLFNPKNVRVLFGR